MTGERKKRSDTPLLVASFYARGQNFFRGWGDRQLACGCSAREIASNVEFRKERGGAIACAFAQSLVLGPWTQWPTQKRGDGNKRVNMPCASSPGVAAVDIAFF
jgi:hypothetical protein